MSPSSCAATRIFSGMDPGELASIAQRVAVERFPAGTVIIAQGQEPTGVVRLVRQGAVDLIDQGRALDRLGEGELFGHPSMLSGLPPGFEVRADEVFGGALAIEVAVHGDRRGDVDS